MGLSAATRRPIVLVHGAWHGGWCWQRLVPLLASAGHAVFAPTFTGLGDRIHLARPDVELDPHVRDLQALFERHNLRDAVLVGHRYGCVLINLLAERMRSRLAQLVCLDAFVPDTGPRVFQHVQPPARPANGLPRAFIASTPFDRAPVAPMPDEVRGQTRWQMHRLAAGHNAMITDPTALARLLLAIADSAPAEAPA